MLENSSRKSPHQPASKATFESIPDPWAKPDSIPEAELISPSWPLPTEPHPLISAAGAPNALQLSAQTVTPDLSPGLNLLQWGLKLKAYSHEKLRVQLGNALTLLCWLGLGLKASQVLLQDELKLKALNGGTLKAQIDQALALLFWLGASPTNAY